MRLSPDALALTPLLFLFALSLASAQSNEPEFGKCGYYPDAQHGKKTTSGETYDKNLLTASHKSHPYGTILRVTRLDNKKSVEVRVNDHAPLLSGYVVDVSRKAADILGLTRDGAAKVKVEVVAPPANLAPTAPAAPSSTSSAFSASKAAPPAASSSTEQPATSAKGAASRLVLSGTSSAATQTQPAAPQPVAYSSAASPQPKMPPAPAPNKISVSELYQVEIKPVPAKTFGVQLLVLTSTENLFREIQKIQTKWPQKIIISHEKTAVSTTFKLILGPFASRKEAEAQQKAAVQKGYPRTFIVEFE